MNLDRIAGPILRPSLDKSLPPFSSAFRRFPPFYQIPSRDASNLFELLNRETTKKEINEIFSYSESIDLMTGRSIYIDQIAVTSTQKQCLDSLIADLSHRERFRRLRAADGLIFILVNTMAKHEDEKETQKIAASLLEKSVISLILSGLAISSRDMFDVEWQDNKEGGVPPACFWATSKELRAHLNLLLLLLVLYHNDDSVMQAIILAKCDNKSIVLFCLKIVACDRADMFPLKKILLVVRWILLYSLGAISFGVLSEDDLVRRAKNPKSSRADVKDVCEHSTRCFCPMTCVENPNDIGGITLVTLKQSPQALLERAHFAQRCVYVGYSNIADIVAEEMPINDPKKIPVCAASERLYSDLATDLRSIIIGMLKILLSIAPNVRQSTHMLQMSRECIIAAGFDAIADGVERFRHYEIIMKSVSFILLRLLKSLRHNDPLQSIYLSTLLQDKNALVIILKFLNQNIAASCVKVNEIPKLDACSTELWSLQNSNQILDIILASKPFEGKSWRKYFAYSNFIRVLQKVSKNNAKQATMMVKFRAPMILKRLLQISQQDFIYYSLKLLKTQMRHLDRKWRSEHMNIITAIFLRLPLRLFDDWLSTSLPTDDESEQIYLFKAIRRLCRNYNQRYFRPEVPTLYDLSLEDSSEAILAACSHDDGASLDDDFADNVDDWLEAEGLNTTTDD